MIKSGTMYNEMTEWSFRTMFPPKTYSEGILRTFFKRFEHEYNASIFEVRLFSYLCQTWQPELSITKTSPDFVKSLEFF